MTADSPRAVCALGVDIGSRSMELVGLDENGEVVLSRRLPTTFDAQKQLRALLHGISAAACVATGYGRNLAVEAAPAPRTEAVTEIKAYAAGAAALFPQARTVLDIGGQDTKAIALGHNGRVFKFEMNDRCAAGTGKFLEYTAAVFQIPIEEFGAYALGGDEALPISSMCTVFAETEATSLMARGKRPENIALGLHAAIASRTLSMLRRVGGEPPVVFAGGVARNPCVCELLTKGLGHAPLIPDDPDMLGAFGAALLAAGGR